MDNATRSERSRTAAIQAALTIIARDGPGKLTFDAIARESGMSKGGLMHQFRTKQEVLKALLEHQAEHVERFSRDYEATLDASVTEPMLMAQIATAREAADQSQSAALALVAAFVEEPTLLAARRDNSVGKLKQIKTQAEDPELAMLRWAAASGLMLSELFGLSPFSARERNRLFDRLLDEGQWTPGAAKRRANGKANGKTNGRTTVASARSRATTSIGKR